MFRIIALARYIATLICCGLWLTAGDHAGAAEPAIEHAASSTQPVAMLHVTDLYRPHNDPDDHWDLACAFSLAWQQEVDILGVFIDHPQTGRGNDPDVLAVAQLNYLTGQAVPTIVGSPRWVDPATAMNPDHGSVLGGIAMRGIRTLLSILRESPQPVVISVLGSCRDVAIAGSIAPDLFAKKCAAIYLNAGSGTPDPAKATRLEWNVSLDPQAYSTIFTLPCPIYWMPCFEEVRPTAEAQSHVAEYETFYRFRQGDLLPHLSREMKNYFNYVFLHGRQEIQQTPESALRPNWLGYLTGPVDKQRLASVSKMNRNMWCTGGFLHAVGKTVNRKGQIVPLATTEDPVFSFDPIQVHCASNGVTQWQPGPASPARYIFHIRDPSCYPTAMTEALRSLVTKLP